MVCCQNPSASIDEGDVPACALIAEVPAEKDALADKYQLTLPTFLLRGRNDAEYHLRLPLMHRFRSIFCD